MILVLILAMALSYGVQDWVEGGVITAVIILNVSFLILHDLRQSGLIAPWGGVGIKMPMVFLSRSNRDTQLLNPRWPLRSWESGSWE